MVETIADPGPFHVRSMSKLGLERRLKEERIGDRVEVLLLDTPADRPAAR